MPCEAKPTAKPRASQARIFKALNRGVTRTAPRMPVMMTRTAVSAGSPPSSRLIAMAMAGVTDFGASGISKSRGAPHPDADRRDDRRHRAGHKRRGHRQEHASHGLM